MAWRSCDDCEAWVYSESGERATRPGPDGKTRLPVVRPKGMPTPCHKCPKIPAGAEPTRTSALCLGEKGAAAFRHYRECRAVGVFPSDPIVTRNARIIRDVYDAIEREDRQLLLVKLGALGVRHAIH